MDLSSAKAWDIVFYGIGVLVVVVVIIKTILSFFRMMKLYVWPKIVSEKDYVATYGRWAVITGGSDGIGKAYAMELARRGMNIFILSNCENMVVSDIKKECGGVEVRHFDVDFSKPEVYERIELELSNLGDIGILINNVGISERWESVYDHKPAFIEDIININVRSMVKMTNIVLKNMLKKNQGLIINMGSASSEFPLPYATLYSSAKSFVETYSICLGVELNDTKIRVKCIQPCFVKTRLLKNMNKMSHIMENNFLLRWTFTDPKQFAASAVSTFGYATPTIYRGYWSHEVLSRFIRLISSSKKAHADGAKLILKHITHDV